MGAVFSVARRLGWVGDSAVIHLRGGRLELAVTARGTVALTGPATVVFEGTWRAEAVKPGAVHGAVHA